MNKKKIIFYLIMCLIFIFSTSAFLSESFQLMLISRNYLGLEKVGKVLDSQGQVHKKLVNDVLWYPMPKDEIIFKADHISTEAESSAVIQLERPVRINLKLGELTQVQIRFRENKPLFFLSKGELEINADVETEVYISTGAKSKTVKLNQGEKVKVSKVNSLQTQIEPSEKKQEHSEVVEGEKKSDINSATQDSFVLHKQKSFQMPVRYPYPENDSVCLARKSSGRFVLFPIASCQLGCQLKVYLKNKKMILEKKFKIGEAPYMDIDYDLNSFGVITWVLFDGETKIEGELLLKFFTNEEFKKQIQSNKPLVIFE